MVSLPGGVTVAQNALMRNQPRQARLYLIQNFLRLQFTTPCPLCGLAARGGDFCRACLGEVTAARRAYLTCAICADELPSALAAPRSLSSSRILCEGCAKNPPAFESSIVAMRYAFPTDALMHELKKRMQLHLATLMGRMLAGAIREEPHTLAKLACIVPIPSSDVSIRRRGFNPPGEIARVLAKALGLPCQVSWLRRTQAGGVQKHLDQQARRLATEHAYESRPNLPAVWIGLVDDVMTTGSTMHFAALALRRGGAAGVVALSAMRTPRLVWHNTQHV